MKPAPKRKPRGLERDDRAILECMLLIRTYSEANARHGNWMSRWRRAKAIREPVAVSMRAAANAHSIKPKPPLLIRMTRIGPGKLDSDNISSALKSVRDGVADWLGINDRRDDLVKYEVAQEYAKNWAVRIEVFAR